MVIAYCIQTPKPYNKSFAKPSFFKDFMYDLPNESIYDVVSDSVHKAGPLC